MKKIGEEKEGEGGYFWVCTIGGILSAGTTHVAVTPLDVLKVNMQVNPVKYYSIASCLSTLLREQGPSVLWRGWATKFIGYGMQGGCRFGLYEYFKKLYSNVFDDRNRNLIFFGSSASAEVVANIVLCPFEAIKIRVQSQPYFGRGLHDGFPKLYTSEGLYGFNGNVLDIRAYCGFPVYQCSQEQKRRLFESKAAWYNMFSRLYSGNSW